MSAEQDGSTAYTIGHSTRSLDAFVAALQSAAIEGVADVRRFPHSRRHPHFNGDALALSLPEVGIAYRGFAGLGGRRGKRQGAPSPHTLWREESFRNYSGYAESDEFREAFAALRGFAGERRVAIMCAEAVWWRCHRRIITDYLIASGVAVTHVLAVGKLEPARLTEGALPRGNGTILYAAAQAQLL